MKQIILAALAAIGLQASASGAEFKGNSVFYWSFKAFSELQVEDLGAFSVGEAEGSNLFQTDDPALINVSTHCAAYNDLDGTSGGVCINIDTAGDRWSERYTCDEVLEPKGTDLFACSGKSMVIEGSGTGKFKEMTGSSTFTQVITGSMPGGVTNGRADMVYDLTY